MNCACAISRLRPDRFPSPAATATQPDGTSMQPYPTTSAESAFSRSHATFVAIVLSLLVFWSLRAAPAEDEEEADPRRAAIAMIEGAAECTINGVTKPVELGLLVRPGATLRTGKKSEMVIFFRQIGTMVRLRPNTTLVLEEMTKFKQDDVLLKRTVLDLQAGEMMCVVRVLDERSKFDIKVPGYLASFDGAGKGRFDLNAKGVILVSKRSERPLRVTPWSKPEGATLVSPGYYFSRNDEKVLAASESMLKKVRPNLDKLEKLAQALTPPPRPEELPRRKLR